MIAGKDRILVAVDTPDLGRARELVQGLTGHVGGFKIGLEMFISHGPAFIREVLDGGGKVFLDLKLHDIPNTVAGAAGAAARYGVSFLTIHALGGPEMIRRGVTAARAAAEAEGLPAPTVLAVTILTSHSDDELKAVGVEGSCGDAVLRLAAMACSAGAGGAVCSPLEVAGVREQFAGGALVVPGIRPASAAADDQSRIATPAQAVSSGADYLVIGRPITQSADPSASADAIAGEIDG
jgi:orotidine-5'-phosphate decarboxylase